MAATTMRNSFNILRSVLPRSAAISNSFLTQRIKCSYVVSRNYSVLCDLQGMKSNDRGKFVTSSANIPIHFSSFRHFTYASGSQFSEFDEPDNTDKADITNGLKKLTLDDIIAQWPDNKPVWLGYRRNHKGQIPPKRTRLRCTTVSKKLLTQNPCPVCRVRVEENYEIESKDVVFLSQFISPHTGEVLDPKKTGVCRQQQKKLISSIEKAREQGHLPFTVPGPRDPPPQFKAAGIPAPNLRNKTG